MKIIFRILAAILFAVFFGFALKNTQEVALSFFWNYEIRGPLVLLLLGFFAAGFIFGILGMASSLFRHKRSLAKQKSMMANLQKQNEAEQLARVQPPLPDTVTNH